MLSMDPLNVDEVKELSWVQCENETCLKWRRIGREEVQKFGEESWFCHMNADTAHNKCEDPEENHRGTIHTADKCGYRYIFSQLPQGTLVWAKMPGHVRWPAVLSPDPTNGKYVMINDETGTPSQYHVEFLGQPHHTHYWVLCGNVDIYGSSSYPQSQRKSKRKRSVFSASAYFHPKRDHYIKNLQSSIEEAEPMRALTCQERLAKCVFIYEPKPEKDEIMRQTTEVTLEKKAVIGIQPDSTGTKKRGRPAKHKEKICLSNSNCDAPSIKKAKKVSFSSRPQLYSIHHDDLSSSDDETPAQQVPVLITSKEERLQADIQLLKRAEEKFERHLAKFSSHHGILLKSSGPQWQGRQISRYQVYMAVQERGGYNMVSANRAWAKVYHEACGTSPGSNHQSVSSAVKTFYTRSPLHQSLKLVYKHPSSNLLPYELYELRSLGRSSSETASTNKTWKKHVNQKEKHLKENKPHTFTSASTTSTAPTTVKWQAHYHKYTSPPIPVPGNNFQPMGELGKICQPVIGDAPVSFEPMDDMGNFRLPIRGKTRVSSPVGVQESSECAQGEQCFKDGQGNTEGSVPTDMELLQEESTQALQELQAMQNMLSSIQQQDESAAVSDCNMLDRPTHIEAEPYASPLSRRKPVLLEFYSMQYGDEAECLKRTNDDTHLVPDITNPGSTSPSALPRPTADRALCPEVYSNIILDMDAMGDEIDRIDDELAQDLMEI